MTLAGISIGREDYNRDFFLRLPLLGVSIAIGHSYFHWLVLEFSTEARNWRLRYIAKRVQGEYLVEMLLRRYAPGWRRG